MAQWKPMPNWWGITIKAIAVASPFFFNKKTGKWICGSAGLWPFEEVGDGITWLEYWSNERIACLPAPAYRQAGGFRRGRGRQGIMGCYLTHYSNISNISSFHDEGGFDGSFRGLLSTQGEDVFRFLKPEWNASTRFENPQSVIRRTFHLYQKDVLHPNGWSEGVDASEAGADWNLCSHLGSGGPVKSEVPLSSKKEIGSFLPLEKFGAALMMGFRWKASFLYWMGNEEGSRAPEGINVLPVSFLWGLIRFML